MATKPVPVGRTALSSHDHVTGPGEWQDFISDFMELTEGARSPELFRKWSGISLVAGALERRVWIRVDRYWTFPNLYVLLVAPPGVGKQVIEDTRELWRETQVPDTPLAAFRVAPDSVTRASIIDSLAKAEQHSPLGVTPMQTYHSMLVASEEVAVLLPAYDLDFIGILNRIYNNPPQHEETRRTGSVRELKITLPQLNILGGAQPGWLGSVFPEEAWSTGLTARIIMVYAADTPLKDFFYESPNPVQARARVLARLGQISQLWGEMSWTPEARALMRQWHAEGGPPQPTHSKLAHYNRRRTTLHVPKLAMISAVARSGQLVIDESDVKRAVFWLTEAEATMPDIFRSMIGKSDTVVIEEMHYFLTQTWQRGGRKPVHERVLFSFLSQRTTSDKIHKILEIAERANMISREAGSNCYSPRPKHEHGLE